jgi:hypothetical protein
MKFLFAYAFLHPLWLAGMANAERILPADLQIDLIFPLNETYAPTQLFPIVFGLNNIDAVWPLEMSLTVRIKSLAMTHGFEGPSWAAQEASLGYSDLQVAFEQAPQKQLYFHFPAINMTNGTTDSYLIMWDAEIPSWCLANDSNPDEYLQGVVAWSDQPARLKSRVVQFSTAPGAQLPDIEATVNSCPERNGNNSAAIRVTDVKTVADSHKSCPVIGAAIKPNTCVFKSAAKELAANVSTALLHEMRCDKGDWRTITAPCPRGESMALLQSAGFGLGWLLLPLAFAISNSL